MIIKEVGEINIQQWGSGIEENKPWSVTENQACGYIRLYKLSSGKVFYHDETGQTLLKKDCMYLFPSHVSYKITCENQNDFELFWIHLDAMPYILDKLICIDADYSQLISNLFGIMQELIEKDENCEKELEFACEILLKQCEKMFLISKLDDDFYKIVMNLKTEALKNITVKSFAIKTGFSVEYFTRLFKEKVKQSPYQFILEHKMSKARELLRDGMSIAEICEKIGYEDLKSFEKIFKKKHGYTASQYRKNQDKYF